MTKIELLKTELENQLQTETARASKWVWHYKFYVKNAKQYSKWLEYRTAMFHHMMTVKKMSVDEFRLAFHNNQYGIQTALFGKN